MLLALGILALGGFAGVVTMWVYQRASNQEKIVAIKAQAKSVRQSMMNPETEESEFRRLMRENLRLSFSLLTKVMGPSLLSSVPVLLVALSLYEAVGDQVFLKDLPTWLSGWEASYFIGVFIGALGLKVALKIE